MSIFFFPLEAELHKNGFRGNVGLQQQAGGVCWLDQRGRAAVVDEY